MFIIPYFIRNNYQSVLPIRLVQIVFFLENRGRSLIQMEAKEIPEWLAANGFVPKEQKKEGDFFLVEIDTNQTHLPDFYSFEQLTVDQTKGTEECWRSFFWMLSDEEKELTHWNECLEEPFFKPLEKIIQSKVLR
jgi:hypothetical protein